MLMLGAVLLEHFTASVRRGAAFFASAVIAAELSCFANTEVSQGWGAFLPPPEPGRAGSSSRRASVLYVKGHEIVAPLCREENIVGGYKVAS